ncbi:MAG: von Willebrand factor type A domain-containing protein [Clostridiales bacterium]|nr:von Willebrand factor type A domain-containing protein [Candidatus Blautia equi]
MRKMLKKAMAATLTAGMLLNTCSMIYAEQKVIPQDELEELKKKLQEEIDSYGWYEYEESIEYAVTEDACVEESASDSFIGDFLYSMVKPTFSSKSESKAAVPEVGMMEASYMDASYMYPFNTEEYAALKEKGFTKVLTDPLSTFAADVDTGSYCNLRRMINDNYRLDNIPGGAVRTEELLNYFDYTVDEKNRSDGKFSVQYELTGCPWNAENDLLLMTVQANQEEMDYKGNNFTFLLDTSGSMDYAEKIALAKCSIKLLSYTLTEEDSVSIVTYSGDSYVALDSCPGNDFDRICSVLDEIVPYGGTNGSGGITAAYELAEKNFVEDGNNRVFILSDGDMNLGITSNSGLTDLITEEKETGIFLTVLGFGSGNYSDDNMESIADAGNGNYFYIDCLDEAQHVLIENQKQTTVTAAKDVKFQAEFNPAQVSEYRLIGYENRDVADDDFQNDSVDGGEVGAGAQVTLLYELVRNTDNSGEQPESGLKYQTTGALTEAAASEELLTVSINYKEPAADTSVTESYAVMNEKAEKNSADMNLAISIAELSMMIHGSDFMGNTDWESIRGYAKEGAKGGDIYRIGYEMMVDQLYEASFILR